jgi:uncharacterized protein (DUF2235 family)
MRLFIWLLTVLLLGGCATREVGTVRPAMPRLASAQGSSEPEACPNGKNGKVVFVTIDGTANTPVSRTAAARLHEMVEAFSYIPPASDKSPARSMAIWYAEGVGSADHALAAKAIGVGVNDDIKKAYAFLTDVWRPGDCLFLNGFSRGAFTVRALGGMLYMAGIPDLSGKSPKERAAIVDDLFDAYKTGSGYATVAGAPVSWEEGVARRRSDRIDRVYRKHGLPRFTDPDADLRRAPGYATSQSEVVIEAITVWDTVQALGLPDGSENPGEQPAHFLLTACNAKAIFQPLALDDNRAYSFTPILAGGARAKVLCPDRDKRQAVSKVIDEVWFSGAHADVGGTYSVGAMLDGELTSVSLNWLLGQLESEACKGCAAMLRLPHDLKVPEDRLTAIHDAKRTSPAYRGLYRQTRKPIAYWSQINGLEPIKLHASVIERLERLFALDPLTPGCPGNEMPAPGKPVLCAQELASYGLVPELMKGGCLDITDWGYRLKPGGEGRPCAEVVGEKASHPAKVTERCDLSPRGATLSGRVYSGRLPVDPDEKVIEGEEIKIPLPRCFGGEGGPSATPAQPRP